MKFNRLRLYGFKSFVDATEVDIHSGLTGIVGPNGCGKSNLLEALRWAMGETSSKSMRGKAMEDVIFSGTNTRPSYTHAEVTLHLDNTERKAPAHYNDSDQLEISRRIERDLGSAYRINGQDARARDVQLLFSDAATGARSTALVRQGQISELIEAKPETRRRILEEAAGIAGLHARRHEAELRLRATETNLQRVEDIIGELDTQLRALKRQARQATRYRNISAQIQTLEAMLLYLKWQSAQDAYTQADTALAHAQKANETALQAATQANTEQVAQQEKLSSSRKNETECAAIFRRLRTEIDALDQEEARARDLATRLREQRNTLDKDTETAQTLRTDAQAQITRLQAEQDNLQTQATAENQNAEAEAETAVKNAQAELATAETQFDATNRAANERTMRLRQNEHILTEAQTRHTNITHALKTQQDDLKKAEAEDAKTTNNPDALATQSDALQTELRDAEAARANAETDLNGARDNANATRKVLDQLLGEKNALARQHAQTQNMLIDKLTVSRGYETALSVALGDDLRASTDPNAPIYWRAVETQNNDPKLPDGAKPLAQFVKGAKTLNRRLAQIGIVSSKDGIRLQNALQPGQCLVSKQGDLWRWDGYCIKADAKTDTHLSQRARIAEIEKEIAHAQKQADSANAKLTTATEALNAIAKREADARRAFGDLRDAILAATQTQSERRARIGTHYETIARLRTELNEATTRISEAEATQKQTLESDDPSEHLSQLRDTVETARTELTQAQGVLTSLRQARATREANQQRIANELQSWTQRHTTAEAQITELAERKTKLLAELETQEAVPNTLIEKRRILIDKTAKAETDHQNATNTLAEAEANLAKIDAKARAAQNAQADAQATAAAAEATREAMQTRLNEATQTIKERLQMTPEEIATTIDPTPHPSIEEADRKLERLRRERDNLGAVNLNANEEAETLETRIAEMRTESDELTQAINKLRYGIGQLNSEGRARMRAAFNDVSEHFQRLFVQLFGGGTAQLELVGSDDPLEAGLDIIAHPPGKRARAMSLLSGGEQALTAIALIFAVFLTNPSPICVLDEVDAPLDDANVERFCQLIREITETTQTRFLIITHHALTMARVDRLIGVTMQERGVSQIISVDLQAAEEFIETGKINTRSKATASAS